MRILCIGLNHKTADVALREKLSFDPAQVRHALGEFNDQWPETEFVVLSTCNRTELYVCRPLHGHPREEEIHQWLGRFHGVGHDEFASSLYTLSDGEAIRHLFLVASGLDSLVTGEGQIIAQMKEAYALAQECGTAGPVLNDMFQTAFHTAKHIRTETGIGLGKVSVASVAVEFVSQIFESLQGKVVLSVGAGKMNRLMLKHLSKKGARRILVANRSAERGRKLAAACGGQAIGLEELASAMEQADIIVCSTGSSEAVITEKMVQAAQRRRAWRPLLMVDIAVPRDIEVEAGKVENVFLYNIDDLEHIVRSTIQMRQGQREAAEAIVDQHVEELTGNLKIRTVAPTINALYQLMEKVAAEELADARNKLTTHDDAAEDAEIVQRALHRTIRRVLHRCAQNLRQSAGTDMARVHISSLRHLFDLDSTPP